MNIDWGGVFIACFFTGLCLLIGLYGRQAFKKEVDKFADFCKKNGFTFNENPDPISQNYNNNYYSKKSELSQLFSINPTGDEGLTFDVFSRSNDCDYTLEMGKRNGDFIVKTLNYLWYVGAREGRNSNCGNYVLCQIESEKLQLPDFYLRNRSSSEKYAALKYNIDIGEDNSFTNLFVIQSLAPDDTKDFFNNEKVKNAFKKYSKKDYYYKADGKYFLVYKKITINDALFDNGIYQKMRLDLMEAGLDIIKEIAI